MAKILTVPAQLDGYYHPSPPARCHSPQSPCTESHHPSDFVTSFDSFDSYAPSSFNSSNSPPSTSESSPQLSGINDSPLSCSNSSLASSVDIEESKESELESEISFGDRFNFPIYEYAPPTRINPSFPIEHQSQNSLASSDQSCDTYSSKEKLLLNSADDTCIKDEPSRHVDYLSHDWKEEDVWASWRYMVCKRNRNGNAIRLENACWRTWAKSKYLLKTVSPEKLNWLKDCDVTWLYGPLCTGVDKYATMSPRSPPGSPIEAKLPVTISLYKTKPILKKRSMSEVMLQRSITSSSLLRQATDVIASQQFNVHQCSPRPSTQCVEMSNCSSTTVTASQITSDASTGCASPSDSKHIHFNNQVLQCIAIDKHDDESDDDEFIFSRLEHKNHSSKRRLREHSKKATTVMSEEVNSVKTIAMLPSTTLKYNEDTPMDNQNSFMSFNFFTGSLTTGSSAPTGIKSPFFDEDEDDDFAGLDWVPRSASTKAPETTPSNKLPYEDLELPNYSYEEEESSNEGLLGRAVDAVNTARDIAHVLWNVGWRK